MLWLQSNVVRRVVRTPRKVARYSINVIIADAGGAVHMAVKAKSALVVKRDF